VSPFEQLDVLCLTRDDQVGGAGQKCAHGVIPPKSLIHTLFRTYANVFKVNQTEHTLLYYLYQLEQVQTNYKMLDMVKVVAADLMHQAHFLKQEEPTLMEEQN